MLRHTTDMSQMARRVINALQNSYRLNKPGKGMIVGNMLDSHPQFGFTLNTIQWPHIQPRSIDQMAQLFRRAGSNDDIDVYRPEDDVYAGCVVRKKE